MERRLAAILAADVVGYSRLMAKDEAGTLAALRACEAELIEPTVSKHNGRIFKRMGDGYLVEFASAVDVVECALAWQNEMLAKENQPLTFRMGINLGEVIAQGDDVYGDSVNIAARLEGMAQPGCIALSDDAYQQVRDRLDVKFHDLGEQEVKNISRPVHVWEWQCKQSLPRRLQNSKLPRPEKPSIVLMPFRNLSGDEQQDSLAEGLRLDIQNALTKVSGVFLIAAGAANALRGITSEDASAGVGVQYVLQGSLRTAGKRVRVAVELVDSAAGKVVWSEQFDRVLDDSFELQDEITARVLMAMNVNLVAGEQAKVWHRTLKDPKALEIFYKGIHAFFRMERDEMARARQHFETVARMHPETSTGATWIALTHWFDIQRGWAQSPETSRRLAVQFAETAAAMEDADGQAHTVLSHLYLMDRKFDEALAAGREAIANRPACANANGFYANVLHYSGEHDEAIRHINLAMRYQPLHPPFFKNILSAAYLAKNELASAISIAKQTIEFAPADILARVILIDAYMKLDRQDLAKDTVAEIKRLDPSFSVTRFADTQYYRSAEFIEQFKRELWSAGLPD